MLVCSCCMLVCMTVRAVKANCVTPHCPVVEGQGYNRTLTLERFQLTGGRWPRGQSTSWPPPVNKTDGPVWCLLLWRLSVNEPQWGQLVPKVKSDVVSGGQFPRTLTPGFLFLGYLWRQTRLSKKGSQIAMVSPYIHTQSRLHKILYM